MIPEIEDIVVIPEIEEIVVIPEIEEIVVIPEIEEIVVIPEIEDMENLPEEKENTKTVQDLDHNLNKDMIANEHNHTIERKGSLAKKKVINYRKIRNKENMKERRGSGTKGKKINNKEEEKNRRAWNKRRK